MNRIGVIATGIMMSATTLTTRAQNAEKTFFKGDSAKTFRMLEKPNQLLREINRNTIKQDLFQTNGKDFFNLKVKDNPNRIKNEITLENGKINLKYQKLKPQKKEKRKIEYVKALKNDNLEGPISELKYPLSRKGFRLLKRFLKGELKSSKKSVNNAKKNLDRYK